MTLCQTVRVQLLQRIHEINERASPAVESPHNDKINLPSSGGHQEIFSFCQSAAPEPTSLTSTVIVQSRFLA
jgi:hypothetical protein